MWKTSEDGLRRIAVHGESGKGLSLVFAGLALCLLSFVVLQVVASDRQFWSILEGVSDSTWFRVAVFVPGLLLTGVGFLMTGVETRLILDEGRDLFVYEYDYGFGSTRQEFRRSEVKGFRLKRIRVEIREHVDGKIDERLDGALDLMTVDCREIPLITDGRGELVAEGAMILRDFFDLELLELVEEKVEYIYRNKRM